MEANMSKGIVQSLYRRNMKNLVITLCVVVVFFILHLATGGLARLWDTAFYTFVLLLFLCLTLVLYFRPGLHPVYRQLRYYGDIFEVAAEIDREYESGADIFKKTITTKNWQIRRSLYMTLIVKRNQE